MPLQSPQAGARSPRPPWGLSGTEEEPLVPLVHLLKEDEGEHGVGAQAGVVGGEALPEAEEALVPHHLQQHVLQEGQCVGGGGTKIMRNLKNYMDAFLEGWETLK